MKGSLVLPSGLLDQPRDPAAGLSDDPLYAGFTEHLHLSSLWQDLASWNNASARWQRLGMTLWDRFRVGLVTKSEMQFSATEERDEVALLASGAPDVNRRCRHETGAWGNHLLVNGGSILQGDPPDRAVQDKHRTSGHSPDPAAGAGRTAGIVGPGMGSTYRVERPP